MKKLILLVISLALLTSVSANTLSYSVILQYDLGKFSLRGIELVGAASPRETTQGGYDAKIISYNGEILYSTSFNMDLERYYALPVSRGASQKYASQTKASLNLLLPYYPNAQRIVISKGKDELLQIDVSRYAACDQNGICEDLETFEVCPGDCTCGNKICEVTESYMSCSSDCVPEQKGDSSLFGQNGAIYLIIAVCLVIAGFISLRKKK